jgi:hypothetical protein
MFCKKGMDKKDNDQDKAVYRKDSSDNADPVGN